MQESFYLQGILSDFSEQDMMKSGAPPDKVVLLHHVLSKNSMVSQVELISKGYHSLVPGVISIFFIDGMGPFKLIGLY